MIITIKYAVAIGVNIRYAASTFPGFGFVGILGAPIITVRYPVPIGVYGFITVIQAVGRSVAIGVGIRSAAATLTRVGFV